MAKQVGPLFFTGTVDGIIFYKLGDNYYMRSKGDYKSGKQMRKDRTYQRTMQKADQFGAASKLVKPIYYRYLPKAIRKHGLFGKLTGKVNRWLQEGKSKEEAKELLVAHCQSLVPVKATPVTTVVASKTEVVSQAPAGTTTKKLTPTPDTVKPRVKQARYLSKWKVKPCGRLHVPKRIIELTSKRE